MHKITFLIVFSLLNFALVFGQEKAMSKEEMAVFKKEIIQQNQAIKTLSTDFVQYKNMSFLSKEIESKGKMLLAAPNRLHWKYTSPFEYSVIFSNQKISINDQGKKNNIDLGNNKKFAKINAMIIGSISGNIFDNNEFKISYFNDKSKRIAKLKPLQKDISQYIAEIVLTFEKDQKTVSEVKLIEPSKDYTRIVFQNKKINPNLKDADFTH
ncbi:MAG TPA: outer membrane lipoprotein carrier protein LolA [Moheibacter sp.]|nr:outer membrane lipoprotein carrier protein LolA [Moheibacter sp.]